MIFRSSRRGGESSTSAPELLSSLMGATKPRRAHKRCQLRFRPDQKARQAFHFWLSPWLHSNPGCPAGRTGLMDANGRQTACNAEVIENWRKRVRVELTRASKA